LDRSLWLIGGALLLLVACAPAAPSPTAAPAKPAESKPAATAAPAKPALSKAEGPAASPATAAKPAEGKPAASPAAKPADAKAVASPAAKAGPVEKPNINVGNVRLAALSAVYVADKLGYLKEEGLTASFKDLGGGAESIPALENGSLDISHAPYVSLLQARDQGFDFVATVTNNASPMQPPHEAAIVVRKDDDSIKTLKDLEGKTVATNTLKGLQYVMAVGAIRKAGGDDKKVKWVEVPNESMVDGLGNKLFDAATLAEPFTTVAESTGRGRVLSYHYIDTAPGLDIGAYIATRAFAQKNPNTVNAFARALKRGHKYLMDDQARARTELGEVSRTPPDVVAKMVMPVWTQSANVQSLDTLANLLVDLGFIKNRTKASEFLWESAL
jgi:NitT/TauT family transport system substrate-binding protein